MSEVDQGIETVRAAPPREWVVAPALSDEYPGARRFFELSGFGRPEQPEIMTAGAIPNLKQIIDGLINLLKDPKDLISLLPTGQRPDVTTLERIKIQNLPGVTSTGEEPPQITMPEAMTQLPQETQEIIRILITEIAEAAVPTPDENFRIDVTHVVSPQRLITLAKVLGIPETLLESKQTLQELLTYFAELSRLAGEITDLAAAESALLTLNKRIPETAMLDTVIPQTGVECVLYAIFNLWRAARNQNAIVDNITIDELANRIPRGPGTMYRNYGESLAPFLREKGFKVNIEFGWGEALRLIRERQAALFVSIYDDHALAVVGVRHSSDQPPRIEFLVANSLAPYWPQPPSPNKPVWVPAQELIAKTTLRDPGIAAKHSIYLISWNRI